MLFNIAITHEVKLNVGTAKEAFEVAEKLIDGTATQDAKKAYPTPRMTDVTVREEI